MSEDKVQSAEGLQCVGCGKYFGERIIKAKAYPDFCDPCVNLITNGAVKLGYRLVPKDKK
jgi:hypothetical protein